MEKDNVFLIDICGTMFRSNTTFDFVKFHWRNSVLLHIIFSLPFRIFNKVVYKVFHKEPLRMCVIHFLKGKARTELLDMAELFMEKYLLPRENKRVIQIINDQIHSGRRPVVISATVDIVAEVVSKHYGIQQYISTLLDYDEYGRCMGTVKRDTLGCKLRVLADLGLHEPYVGVVTDNYSDADIIDYSQECYLVSYDGKQNEWLEYIDKKKFEQCHIIKI